MKQARAAIAHNVRVAIETLGPLSGFALGPDRLSVQWMEGYLQRLRGRPGFDPDEAAGIVGVLGSFLGECIAVNAGGRWAWQEQQGTWGIELANGNVAFPFAKVEKLLRNGVEGGDSILSFYDMVVDYLASGRP